VIERSPLVVAVAVIVVTLSGCSTAPQPIVTVNAEPLPAVTVTATPAAASGDTPIDALGAWTACAGFLMTYTTLTKGSALLPGQNSYSPDLVTQTGDSFKVQLVGPVGGRQFNCTVGGTYGAPTISQWIIDKGAFVGTP